MQAEGVPTRDAFEALRSGIALDDGPALSVSMRLVEEPARLWPRNPLVREHKSILVSWLKTTLHEGRSRQVRHMTVHVGFPTPRLIHYVMGNYPLDNFTDDE